MKVEEDDVFIELHGDVSRLGREAGLSLRYSKETKKYFFTVWQGTSSGYSELKLNGSKEEMHDLFQGFIREANNFMDRVEKVKT